MNHRHRTMIAVLAGALLLSAAPRVRAVEDEGHDKGKQEHRMKWAEKMGLSPEETAKLKDAFKAEKETAKPLRRSLRDALLKLHDQVEDKASDKDLQASLDRVDQAREALRAEHEMFHKKLAALIPVEKRAKMTLMMAHRRMRRMRARRGMDWKRGDNGERDEGEGGKE